MTLHAVDLPLKDQLAEPLNGPDDCIPDSFASVVEGLTGRHTTGAELLGLVYGDTYTGFTDPARFADVLRGFGVGISYSNAGAAANADRAVAELAAGRPSMVAIPSDWDDEPPTSKFAHMCILASFDTDTQTCELMNPYRGQWTVRSLDWLKERMAACSYQGIWICEALAMYWTVSRSAAGAITGAKGANGEDMGSGFAAKLAADGKLDLHPAKQGTGEVVFSQAPDGTTLRSFAAFIDGSALFYTHDAGGAPDYLGWGQLAWALLELWSLVQSGAGLVSQLTGQLGDAKAEIAKLEAAPAPAPANPTPPTLAEALAVIGSALGIAKAA